MQKCYPREYDTISVKQLGDHTVRVVYTAVSRTSGFEDDTPNVKKGTAHDKKLENNIVRAKTAIKELVLSNPWRYWCTFTISPQKYDRHNLARYKSDLAKFIRNYNRYCDESDRVQYVFVPEMHKDGAWHMHGFLNGVRDRDIYTNEYGYLSWRQYEEKFGFISMSPIKDIDRAASYMLKYISKDIGKGVTDLGAHLYYASQGLKRAELLYRGHAQLHCDWDYEHPEGYCKVKTFDTRIDDISEYIEVLP